MNQNKVKITPQEATDFLNDRRLRMAVDLAVKDRRQQLKEELRKLEFNTILEDWNTVASMTTADIIRVGEIKRELQIIENLMIRTNKFYEQLGGKTKIVIQRSDRKEPERTFTI